MDDLTKSIEQLRQDVEASPRAQLSPLWEVLGSFRVGDTFVKAKIAPVKLEIKGWAPWSEPKTCFKFRLDSNESMIHLWFINDVPKNERFRRECPDEGKAHHREP